VCGGGGGGGGGGDGGDGVCLGGVWGSAITKNIKEIHVKNKNNNNNNIIIYNDTA
jgi:hypothetical protein